MKLAGIFVLPFLVGLSPSALAQADVLAAPQNATGSPVKLTCLPQSNGMVKQKLYIEAIDGKAVGNMWRAVVTSAELTPGQHRIGIRYVNLLVVKHLLFNLNAEAGHSYSCISQTTGPNLDFARIRDESTQAVVAEPASSSCYLGGDKCV